MSRAASTFETSVQDATMLLEYFEIARKESSERAEVLKRAGLVLALTAWETYVEDRVMEAAQMRLRAVEGSPVGKFVQRRLEEELTRFHNPSAEKTKQIFLDFLEVDVTAGWTWLNYDPPQARKTLNELLQKRGGLVHRSKAQSAGPPAPHAVKKEDLEKAIRFLRALVVATDKALEAE